jgi:hypothetical protein
LIAAKNIALLENLSEYDLEGGYYDLHNEFECIGITHEAQTLLFHFRKNEDSVSVSMKFENVVIEKTTLQDFNAAKDLTLDNLYRGRFEKNGTLIEFDSQGRSYFYLEFYEEGEIEFWSDGLSLKEY